VEEEWLSEQLADGRSIGWIAREVGKAPSTVGYWVRRFGLSSAHAERHAARGRISGPALAAFVAEGLTLQGMAERLGIGRTSVRHWLRAYGLKTQRARFVVEAGDRQRLEQRPCRTHGPTTWVRTGSDGRLRCKLCRTEHVTRRRRRLKAILVAEAGGACVLCGYDRYPGALQFHHVDPATKSFAHSTQGVARSLEKAREEARKCVLVCANCHAEVEAGLATIAL